ncbi:MAG: hypothetical protein PVH00_03120 [Gemmatimonadota bacterium]|jgi:hypothetical protein
MGDRGLLAIIGIGLPVGLAASLVSTGAIGDPGVRAVPATPPAGSAVQQATDIEWFWAINGPVAADGANDLSIDGEGNVFLAGAHSGLDIDHDGTVEFKSGATVYEGASNPLFMKLGRRSPDEPMRILWARSPHTPADRSQTRIAVDGRGGAYVTGAFMESLSFEDGPTLRGAGGNDAFVARYDGEGSVMWARVFGGAGGSDAIYGLASDARSNVYIVGTASGTFPLDDRGAEFSTSAQRAAVLVSWGPDGSLRWTRTFGAGVPLAYAVRVAPGDRVWVTGEFEGEADLDGDGEADLPAPRDRDGFVARFDADGALLGAWAVPLPAVPTFAADGDLLLAGGFGGPLEQRYGRPDFDGDGEADVEASVAGSTGAWIARYSADGELRWVRSYALEQPADIEVRGDLIAMSGNYRGLRDLDEDGRTELRLETVDPASETDLAILVLSARDGRIMRLWIAPGPGNDWANAVAFLPDRPSLLVTGAIQLTADFTGDGKDGEGWIVCENRGDIYVAQYRLPEPPAVVADDETEDRQEIELNVAIVPRDVGMRADLTWTGVVGDRVDVFRNGKLLTTVPNSGSHTDRIPRDVPSPYRYKVCDRKTAVCSATWQGG